MSFSVSRRDGVNVRASRCRTHRAARTHARPCCHAAQHARQSARGAARSCVSRADGVSWGFLRVRRACAQCEWGSNGLGALFAQRGNVASPSFLRMLSELPAFQRDVLRRATPRVRMHAPFTPRRRHQRSTA
jgi:hypothetical protein